MLQKLDVAFSSLLKGRHAETGDALPGFESGRGKMSTTEKVRLRGLVACTRVTVIDVAAGGTSGTSETNSATDTEDGIMIDANTEMGDEDDEDDVHNHHRRWEMELARVYERTIIELGIALDTPCKDRSESSGLIASAS